MYIYFRNISNFSLLDFVNIHKYLNKKQNKKQNIYNFILKQFKIQNLTVIPVFVQLPLIFFSVQVTRIKHENFLKQQY